MTKKKKIRVVLLIVIPVVLAAMYILQQYVVGKSKISEPPVTPAAAPSASAAGREIPVRIHIAQEEEVVDGIDALGILVANEVVEVTSEVQGKVTEILFKEGAPVQAGQVLVRVNDDDLQAQLKRYQFQEQTLRENVERQRILFEREAISQQAYDQVQTEYNVLLADIELLNVRIDKTQIRAPFSGVIGFRYISEGSYLQAGTQIAQLVDYNTLKVEFSLSERHIGLPLMGRTVIFTTPDSNKPRRATIYAMEPQLDESTRSIVVRARYNNAGGELRPAMSANVLVPTSQAQQMLMVPTEAIVPSLDGMSVWVARSGRAELIPIETGDRNATLIPVLKGLQPGDSVIITGLMQLREGARIHVNN